MFSLFLTASPLSNRMPLLHLTYPAPLSQVLCRSETRHDTVSSPKTEKLELVQVRLTPEKVNSMFPLHCSQLGHFLDTCSFCTGREPAHQWSGEILTSQIQFHVRLSHSLVSHVAIAIIATF